MDVQAEIDYSLVREREERVAATQAPTLAIHDAHLMMAERYADRASRLFEARFDARADEIIAANARLSSARKMLIGGTLARSSVN